MKLYFDSNLPGLLEEVLNNPTTGALKMPIIITRQILEELAKLAIEIDDDRLHICMLRLGLYEISNKERVKKIKLLTKKLKGGAKC